MTDSRAATPAAGAETTPRAEDDRHDAKLAQEACDGDARAFEELLGRHEARVLRLVRLLGVRVEDRDDVAQDVFLRVFRHLSGFRAGGGSFGGWLYRITVNSAHDHRVRLGKRRAVEQQPAPAASAAPEPVDAAPGPAGGLERRAAAARLERALGDLSERERAVFVLCRVEGLETLEVARILGISRITVRRHLGRARDRLQRTLEAAEKKSAGD